MQNLHICAVLSSLNNRGVPTSTILEIVFDLLDFITIVFDLLDLNIGNSLLSQIELCVVHQTIIVLKQYIIGKP